MSDKPRLLDTFCKAGGAGMGYHRAGFEVVGVDIEAQQNYPFEFIKGDAIEYIRQHGHEFDAIHASPPCQRYSALKRFARQEHKALVAPTREALELLGKPYVIENVPGAPLINPIILCGSMFNLHTGEWGLKRHRLFECNFYILMSMECNHRSKSIGLFGDKARDTGAEKRHYSKPKATRGKPTDVKRSFTQAQEAIGIGWMNIKELCQAVPPAYTEYIGKQLLAQLKATQ